MKQGLLFFLAVLLLASCGSSILKVQSNPAGTSIYLQRYGQEMTKIGVTPFDLTSEQFPELFGNNPVTLLAEKDGFLTQSLIIPEASRGTKGSLFINMKPAPELPNSCKNSEAASGELAFSIAQAQYLLMKKQLDQAEIILVQLNAKYPKVSVIFDLMGNLYYLRKDAIKALRYYKTSLELKSDNIETARMVQKLEPLAKTMAGQNGTTEGNNQ